MSANVEIKIGSKMKKEREKGIDKQYFIHAYCKSVQEN